MAVLRLLAALLLIGVLPLASGAKEPPATPSAAEPPGTGASLEGLVARALRDNPGLRAQRARIAATERKPSQARALPDPVADLEVMNLPVGGGLSTGSFTENASLGVTQMLPFPGKRRLAAKAAQGEIALEQARLAQMEQRLRADVLGAAMRNRTAETLLGINRQTQEALRAAVESALARYAAGGGNQADVLLAQSAVTEAAAERQELERQRDVARARLESLTAGPVDPVTLEEIEVPPPQPLPGLRPLLAFAEARAPGVVLARADAALAAAMAEAAEREFRPDFMVGARYRFNDMAMGGGDTVTAMVGMTLPFFHRKDRYTPALEGARFRELGALEEVSAARNESSYMLAEAYQAADRDAKVFAMYDGGLLPQAQQAYEASLSAYAAGQADFATLLMALNNRYRVASDAAMARGEYHQMVAEMEAVLGAPLSVAAAHPGGDALPGGTP